MIEPTPMLVACQALISSLLAFGLLLIQDLKEPGVDEAVKIIEFVERDFGPTSKIGLIDYLGDEYFACLLALKQFDKIFDALLNKDCWWGEQELVEEYCRQMIRSGFSDKLIVNLEKLQSRVSELAVKRPLLPYVTDPAKRCIEKYLRESGAVKYVMEGNFDAAIEQLEEIRERRQFKIETDHDEAMQTAKDSDVEMLDSFREQSIKQLDKDLFYLNATIAQLLQATKGSPAAKEWTDHYLSQIPESVNRARKELWLANLLKRKKNSSKRTGRQIDAEQWAKLKLKLNHLSGSKKSMEWIEEAVDALRYKRIPRSQSLAYFERLKKELSNLDRNKADEYKWLLVDYYIEQKDWSELLSLVGGRNPKNGDAWKYQEVLSVVARDQRTKLDEFVHALPDNDEDFRYNRWLLDVLLHNGFQDKATGNYPSVDDEFGHIGKKVKFYDALLDADYRDVERIVDAYLANDSQVEDASGRIRSDFNFFYNAYLGDDHLAMIAIRGGSKIALDVARRTPDELSKYRRGSDLGRCMTALIRRKKIDLAIELFHLGTEAERETVSLVHEQLFREPRWQSCMSREDWKKLHKVIPQPFRMLNFAMEAALKDKEKQKVLDLAEQSFENFMDCRYVSAFVELGWESELLDLAVKVQAAHRQDRKFERLVEDCAEDVSFHAEFEDAASAISFARKYFRRKKMRGEFLLNMARRWAED